ncbi:hypothetical protein BDR06DRAFT_521876 [Suillus hirtellus]|nr:hypothetical protein BDR06DRAFT_521876 [Suillus hirtellus]
MMPASATLVTSSCCESSTSTSEYNKVARSLGLEEIPASVAGYVARSCSPISAIGIGSGATCNQQPMCCSNSQMVRCKSVFSALPVSDREFSQRPCQHWVHSNDALSRPRYIFFLISFIDGNTALSGLHLT